MIWLIIGIIIIVSVSIITDVCWKDELYTFISFSSSLVLTICLIIVLTTISMKVCNNTSKEKYDYSIDLVALTDNIDTSGELNAGVFYRSGYIENDLYYYYLAEENKGIKQYKILAENTYIKETDGVPKIEFYKTKTNYPKFWVLSCFNTDEVDYVVIYVPKECIKNEFNIDLE